MTHVKLTRGISLSADHSSKTQGNKVESAISNNIHISYPPVDEKNEIPNPVPIPNNNEVPSPSDVQSSGRSPSSEREARATSGEESNDKAELYFLRKVLDIYRTQKLYFRNKKIICSPDDLKELIRIISGCDSVELEYSPLDVRCSCIDSNSIPLQEINKIWVITATDRVIFNYAYTKCLSFFARYDISLEFIKLT